MIMVEMLIEGSRVIGWDAGIEVEIRSRG